MTLDDFQKFIDEQDAFFRSLKNTNQTERERILARTVKISEEFGELCDEVLASIGQQRAGKMENRSAESLGDEFADVVITTFLLAKAMDIDVLKVIERKTKKIKMKHNKQFSEQFEK